MTKVLPLPPNEASSHLASQRCELGRRLGDCALRRAGCGSLYEVLRFTFPPHSLIVELRGRSDLAPEVAAWLHRLDTLNGGHSRPW